jgi:hypothetical protein
LVVRLEGEEEDNEPCKEGLLAVLFFSIPSVCSVAKKEPIPNLGL